MGFALIATGTACAAYGALILATRTGSRFYRVWLGIAAASLALGALLLPEAQAPLRALLSPGAQSALHALATVAGTLLLAVLIAFALLSVRIMAAAHGRAPNGLDYVIVLGAQVYPSGQPSRVLEYRLQAALSYLEANPRTRAVVSGGQGPNEPCAEANAMAEWLRARGVENDRIVREDRSTTTAENLSFSLKAIATDGEPPRIGIVTNRFHVYRALRIARRQGLNPVWAIAAPSTAWRLPHNLLRECLGVIKNTLTGRM